MGGYAAWFDVSVEIGTGTESLFALPFGAVLSQRDRKGRPLRQFASPVSECVVDGRPRRSRFEVNRA